MVEETLDTLLQDDPNLPSLPYQAYENVPIHVGWTRMPVQLATGFDSMLATRPDVTPLRNTPFVSKQSQQGAAPYRFSAYGGNMTFRSTASSQTATSYEHLDLKGTVSVGGSFLGASGQVAFCRDVHKNRDVNKVSIQSTQRVGSIELAEQPVFTAHKLAGYCMTHAPETHSVPHMATTSSRVFASPKMKDVKVQAKFLGLTKPVYNEHTDKHSDQRSFDITYSGFDTLRAYQETTHAIDERAHDMVKAHAVQSVADGKGLMARVQQVMDELQLIEGATLTHDQLTEVCRSGLVVELQLMPCGGLKEYAEIMALSVPSVPSVRDM
ncbi:hypothetical protein B0H16DRAFT_1717455 [Mycena metata]|uniref:Uncharacterized protein n=1 Tax=Mycena metata TaxID=1033252 RepID=A0AAD7NLJ7_9AGAR|nr:hypothetical protein B0H16DRAFT_1717455 [Mycena metata]